MCFDLLYNSVKTLLILGRGKRDMTTNVCWSSCKVPVILVEFVLLRSMWPHVYVICVCLVFLSVGDLQITNRQEHQTRTDDIHMRPHTA
jgi:hypothetical protein